MITYNQFLANVTDEDLRILNLTSIDQTISTNNAAEADAYVLEFTRLFDNGLLVRASRQWELKDGVMWHTFSGTPEPLASAYLIQLQLDRIEMSRQPLP